MKYIVWQNLDLGGSLVDEHPLIVPWLFAGCERHQACAACTGMYVGCTSPQHGRRCAPTDPSCGSEPNAVPHPSRAILSQDQQLGTPVLHFEWFHSNAVGTSTTWHGLRIYLQLCNQACYPLYRFPLYYYDSKSNSCNEQVYLHRRVPLAYDCVD